MYVLTDEQAKKWKLIQPLLDDIDLQKSNTASMISAYNRVAASGRPSLLAMKLLLLSHKGIIDYDEFIAFVCYNWSPDNNES